jgi:hypothetical protein
VWCLGCAVGGTWLAAVWGRKPTALLSQGLLISCLFIIGGLSKMYADNPDNASSSLVYGDVAVMFLFQGFYSIGWTPLLTLYPPEILNYSIRANGVAGASFSLNAFACVPLFTTPCASLTDFFRLVFVFIMPIGLNNIGWKMYMVNASWDIVILGLIVSLLLTFLLPIADESRHIIGSRQKARRSRKLMHCLRARSTPMCRMWSWFARAISKLTSRLLRRNLIPKLWVRRSNKRT